MLPQDLIRAFMPKVRATFKAYCNNVSKSEKALINVTKRA